MRKAPDGTLVTDEAGELSWVALCLEYFISAQGATITEAMQSFRESLAAEILLDIKQGREPLSATPPAPAKYVQMWEDSIRLAEDLPLGGLDRPVAKVPEISRGAAEVRIHG